MLPAFNEISRSRESDLLVLGKLELKLISYPQSAVGNNIRSEWKVRSLKVNLLLIGFYCFARLIDDSASVVLSLRKVFRRNYRLEMRDIRELSSLYFSGASPFARSLPHHRRVSRVSRGYASHVNRDPP